MLDEFDRPLRLGWIDFDEDADMTRQVRAFFFELSKQSPVRFQAIRPGFECFVGFEVAYVGLERFHLVFCEVGKVGADEEVFERIDR